MTSSVTSSTPDSSGRAGRVVVTGGSGFVGRAVVRALLDRGTSVVVADREPLPASVRDDRVTHVQGELADPDVRDRALSEGCTGVIHLAAITSVLKSAEQPAETFETNVRVTHELLELARQRGIGQFVLASTNAVVGDIGHGTISEDLPLQPLTPYGATKAAGEMLLSGYAGAYGLATASLRFTNIYGPGMGHKDSFIPRLMRAALAGEGVEVYGDGSQSRDFVHLSDVVQGIMAAFDKQYTGSAIIGSGESISVTQLIEAVRAATGEPLPVEHVPAKQGEMPAVIVDVSTAKRELGYTPTMGLTDGLRTVWDDFRAAAADGTP
ncbi:NAD-dependent epimerase/dehydratase family protein [Allosaccharopolyspora coralli]|uniref:NAD-dependent epimerase/dehydratase family protein n=1 Tax=Allosaccharopolyspora coralli TaxID=2665642 RepID=A0A5Q3Q8I4_9PSEU|nr:NAD-dependent epimerase/dehydratase family protein [Allosaccharopolyspora coralli]QGK70792.1 NAD-dependent epimerase/dehydratase family protein [Allosaccharopolyspora coralli]